MKFKSNVELEALSNATTDTDRFIVSDSNTLKYRTGSQVLSDIGGQASLTNPVTGTGTLNFVSKFTSTGSTLGNSLVYDNGTNVGIGTTSPGAKLHVNQSGTSGVQTIVAALSSTSLRPVLQFSESTAATITAGMSIEYNGVGSGADNYMAINSVTGSPQFVVMSGGNVGIGTTSPGSGYAYDIKLDIVAPQLGGIPLRLIRDSSIVNYGAMIALAAKNSASEIITYGAITGGIIDSTDGSEDGYVSIRTIKAGVEAEKVRVDESGNVGIGTTAPFTIGGTAKLSTYASGPSTFGLSSSDAVYLRRYGTGNYQFQTTATGGNNGNLSLQSYGGNVGIGTTSPGYKLQVGDNGVGDGNITMKANGNGVNAGAKLTFNMNVGGGNADSYIAQIVPISYDSLSSGTHNSLNFKVGVWNNNADAGVSRMTILSNGNIGIGTTDPDTARLAVIGGNVGIGTTNPGAKLTVQGDDSINAFKITDSGDGDGFKVTSHTTQGTYVQIYNAAHTQTIMLDGRSDNTARHTYFNGGGNVGIGTTSPAVKLEIISASDQLRLGYSSTNYSDIRSDSVGGLLIKAGNNYIINYINGSEKMRITSAGNVGINTTSPGAKLDIQPTTADRKVTRIANDVMSTYFYDANVDAILAWTCGSYYQAEVVITANQTNSGDYNNIYIRGIWSNNHTSHHWDELERVGYLTGSTFTITVGQNGATTNSGRLELDFDYVSGSFSQLNVRVTDFYGTHAYTIT